MLDKRVKRGPGDVGKIVLKVIGVAGFVGVALLAPNALQALDSLGLIEGPQTRRRHYLKSVIGRLESRGYIMFEQRGKGEYQHKYVRLTKKGEQELERYLIREKTLERRRWDGKYRVVIFDVKEYKRSVRDRLRRELESLGFARLQNSVWVFPYPCEEVIAMLKSHLHLGGEVLHLLVDQIENDKWLKKKFGV